MYEYDVDNVALAYDAGFDVGIALLTEDEYVDIQNPYNVADTDLYIAFEEGLLDGFTVAMTY